MASFLKRMRGCIRTEITKTYTKLFVDPGELSTDEKKSILDRFNTLKTDIRDLDQKVLEGLSSGTSTDEEFQKEYDCCAAYEDKISAIIGKVEEVPVSSLGSLSLPRADSLRSQLKLPHLPLPTFGNEEGENIHRFFVEFEAIINKYGINNYEKFIFLRGQLRKRPLVIVKGLETCNQNYRCAKDLLLRAFGNELTQQYDAIKRLSEMKLAANEDPYAYISNMKLLTESFTTLKIDSKLVLQYFFWTGMNTSMQQNFVHITNKNKPSLAEINEHVFEAAERYCKDLDCAKSDKSVKAKSPEQSAAAFATNVGVQNPGKIPYCSLCSTPSNRDASHSTFNCTVYSTTKAKRDKLVELNGCTKCGNISHKTDQCRFFFKKKCSKCSKFHFSFLCMADNSSQKNNSSEKKAKKPEPNNNNDTTSAGSVESSSVDSGATFFSLNVNSGHSSVVPTFSVDLGCSHVLHGMKDSGCQTNFITNNLADELNLPVLVEKHLLKIGGFNSTKSLITKIVHISLFGRSNIAAVCVPEIRTNLNLPQLDLIVQAFKAKGYTLADKLLKNSTSISNLNFVLGTLDSQILPQSDKVFGQFPQSMYSVTPIGILLSGCTDRLMKNLDDLPLADYEETVNVGSSFSSENTVDMSDDQFQYSCLQSNSVSINEHGEVDESILDNALKELTSSNITDIMHYDQGTYEDKHVQSDQSLIQFVLNNTNRLDDGRLQMPLLWNGRVSHRLASNFNLAKAVLKGNFRKLQSNELYLKMYNESILEQFNNGIIERIEDVPSFLREHPNASFLAHMGVFKLSRESTKCRVVYLSNLCEKDPRNPMTISHNQAMYSGPNLNKKISTSIIKLRFDSFLLNFDIAKAFLNIALSKVDSDRLLFLWYRNIAAGDKQLVAYRCLRLPFGLRCSPTILMLALYKILMLNTEGDSSRLLQLKKLIYDLIYVDNGAVTSNDSDYIVWACEVLSNIFSPYKFKLQQFSTNVESLQKKIDSESDPTPEVVKLFGMSWNRTTDMLLTHPMKLSVKASTKRQMLSSIAENYDVFQLCGPLLNRARLFIHRLQCDGSVGWDDLLGNDLLHEWEVIAKQVNTSKSIPINRFIGRRDGNYQLVAYTDASSCMFGCVIYILNLSNSKLSFLIAKNRIVNKQLSTKSIPALELHALTLGIETLMSIRADLTDNSNVVPINISKMNIFSDSMVSLNWLNSSVHKLDKMQRKAPFVLNRLEKISQMCDVFPVTFNFIAGCENPADAVTRPISYRQLTLSNYVTGPLTFCREPDPVGFTFTVPREDDTQVEAESTSQRRDLLSCASSISPSEPLISTERYSSFSKLASVYSYVLKFVANIKSKISNSKYSPCGHESFYQQACSLIVRTDQNQYYPEVFEFFNKSPKAKKSIPSIVNQLNLFLDGEGLIRVRSKFDRWRNNKDYSFPILLAKNSTLTNLIISNCHQKLAHAGCYSVLAELRKKFYIPNYFSKVKQLLKSCLICRRVNARAIKLNQSPYREFRINPPQVPFRTMFIDYFGPYEVRRNSHRDKVYVLILTCMWCRAINLKLCYDLSVKEFIRSFQLHVFEFGIPELVISDLGTQLVAGANIISNICNDTETKLFFDERGIKSIKFEQYFKGCSAMGSMVESCVKLSKRLIYGAIGKTVLDVVHFDFIIQQTVHLVNKRPVAFREALRDDSSGSDEVPAPITPELLVKGYDIPSIHLIPTTSFEYRPSGDSSDTIAETFSKLTKIREKLTSLYHNEFLPQMISQAVDKKNRYKPVTNKIIQPGDIVLLKEDFSKAVNYPLAVVREVIVNDLGEVTCAILMKGSNREIVKRHASSLIPFMRRSETVSDRAVGDETVTEREERQQGARGQRAAAVAGALRNSELAANNLV